MLRVQVETEDEKYTNIKATFGLESFSSVRKQFKYVTIYYKLKYNKMKPLQPIGVILQLQVVLQMSNF